MSGWEVEIFAVEIVAAYVGLGAFVRRSNAFVGVWLQRNVRLRETLRAP